jgi:hypothetical protein
MYTKNYASGGGGFSKCFWLLIIAAGSKKGIEKCLRDVLMALTCNKDTVTWQLKGRNNGARRNCPLLGNVSINTYHSNGYK